MSATVTGLHPVNTFWLDIVMHQIVIVNGSRSISLFLNTLQTFLERFDRRTSVFTLVVGISNFTGSVLNILSKKGRGKRSILLC